MFKKDDQENIETLSIRHSGLIPEGHPDREKVAQHINKLRTSNPNEARRLYDRFISGGGQYTKEKPEINVKISKSEKIDPQGHYVKIESNPNWHRVLDVKDTGISASKPGGGNSYKIRCNKTGNISNVHQSKITDYVFGEDMSDDLSKSKNHPKGGLSRKEAKKLGIHAGIETHDEVERKGGVSKLSDKTSARRRSFCARHCGMKRKFPKAYKDRQSKGNKALRVWHCGSCSNWLKKSIGNNDAVRFYEDNENLIIEFDNDVPSEIETLVVASVLAKGFEENE